MVQCISSSLQQHTPRLVLFVRLYFFGQHFCYAPRLSEWLSGTSFLLTFTVLCGLPLCWDDLTWCSSRGFVNHVFDDPLRGFGCPAFFFRHFLHKPQRNPKATLKNHMKVYIVKYLWGVAHVLRVLLVCVSIQSIPTKHIYISGWWFGTWLLFSISYMGCHPSHWHKHLFQDGYCTTNQIYIPSGKLT